MCPVAGTAAPSSMQGVASTEDQQDQFTVQHSHQVLLVLRPAGSWQCAQEQS